MKLPAILTTLICGASLQIPASAFEFTFLSATNPTPNNAAEVVTYTRDGFRVGATYSDTTNVDPNLHSFSLIASTYVDGAGIGTIGVIGPTRMHYSRAIAVVDGAAQAVSRVLRDPN